METNQTSLTDRTSPVPVSLTAKTKVTLLFNVIRLWQQIPHAAVAAVRLDQAANSGETKKQTKLEGG